MFLRLVFLLLFGAISRLYGQEAFSDNLPTRADAKSGEPTPESAWLDLRQNTPRHSTPQNAPPWVEAVTLFPAQGTGDTMPKTVFRIHVARPSQDYQVLLFRLFFDDKPGQQPELVAWDESGTHILRSGALGSGINLPASDSVMIPMTDTSSIDIEEEVSVIGIITESDAGRLIPDPSAPERKMCVPDSSHATNSGC